MMAVDMKLNIDGMTCERCAERIKESLLALPEVDDAKVSFKDGTANLRLNSEPERERLNAAIERLGDYVIVSDKESSAAKDKADADDDPSLFPLVLVIGYVAGVTLLFAFRTGNWHWEPLMRHFMAGFFIAFSFFKLLDLPGFVSTYRDYDLVAMKVKAWAWVYPFVELALGVFYLFAWLPVATNVFTCILMLTGAAGVLLALVQGKSLDCGCLGTALNLPMTKVTLIEDLSMAVMAALMLFY